METRELRYFLAIAREGSISKAAKALFLAQPSLTKQMQNLEKEIGRKLFIRGRRNIELTSAGILLKERAEAILELLEKTKDDLRTSEEKITGTITIGAGESYLMKDIAKAAEHIRKVYTGIRFQFLSGDSLAITEKLDQGLLDFGVLVMPADLKGYDSLLLKEQDIWGAIMRKDDPMATKGSLAPRALVDKPLIVSNQTLKHSDISMWFGKELASLNIVATYDLIYNASIMVKEGLGYLIGINNIIDTSNDSELCFIPFHPEIKTSLAVVWRKYQKFTKAAQVFLEVLKQSENEKARVFENL